MLPKVFALLNFRRTKQDERQNIVLVDHVNISIFRFTYMSMKHAECVFIIPPLGVPAPTLTHSHMNKTTLLKHVFNTFLLLLSFSVLLPWLPDGIVKKKGCCMDEDFQFPTVTITALQCYSHICIYGLQQAPFSRQTYRNAYKSYKC